MGDLDISFLQAFSFGPEFSLPAHIRVIHSTEGPMSRGNARALAGPNWFGGPKAGTSAHDIFDPSEGVKMVPDNRVAWHVGPGGNSFTRGSEHCAYTRYTREEWLSEAGQAMLDLSARYNAAAAKRDGVQPRWLSLTQLAHKESGFCTHNDIRLVFGGTTHSDPGPNFPYDWYMDRVRFYYDGGDNAAEGDWEAIVAASGDDILEMLGTINKNLSGTYYKDTQPNATQEAGSLKGITARLDEISEKLDKLLPSENPPVTPAGK